VIPDQVGNGCLLFNNKNGCPFHAWFSGRDLHLSKVENFGSRNGRRPENFPTTYEQEGFRKKKRIFVLLSFILSDIDYDHPGDKTGS
jgi:hypothetical protein